jgi:hypothetical protein
VIGYAEFLGLGQVGNLTAFLTGWERRACLHTWIKSQCVTLKEGLTNHAAQLVSINLHLIALISVNIFLS